MISTKNRSKKSLDAFAPGGGFEDLRVTFYERLRHERAHLAAVGAALARGEENPASMFSDLQFRAHKLRGGALIFEFTEIADAAGALEHAAAAAADRRSDAVGTDDAVRAALAALVRLSDAAHSGAVSRAGDVSPVRE